MVIIFAVIYLTGCALWQDVYTGTVIDSIQLTEIESQVNRNNTIDAFLHQLEIEKRPTTVQEWGNLFGKTVGKFMQTRDSANFSKFLVHIREKADILCAAVGDTIDNTNYPAVIKKHFKDESNPQELRAGNYYRSWVLLLHDLIKNDCKQLKTLRVLLKNDRHKIHTFASQMQQLRTIDLYHDQRMHITYFNTVKINESISNLDKNLRFAVENFFCSEDGNCK